jgi:hypothetical protein
MPTHVGTQPSKVSRLIHEPKTILHRNVEYILAEEHLDGKWTKWNNNAGGVFERSQRQTQNQNTIQTSLLAIEEHSEEEDETDEPVLEQATVDDVPQCFSHFTYVQSDGKNLVCDIQGVWNEYDGYVLTDPVIHHKSQTRERGSNGKTDKGPEGMRRFFHSHRCVCVHVYVCMVD